MEQILEKLSSVLTAEDLNEVKKSIQALVEAKVKEESKKEAKKIASKANTYCEQQIAEGKKSYESEINESANTFVEEIRKQLEDEANKKYEKYAKQLEEASEQYIFEVLDEKFTEKYGEELQAIEEKVITGLDKWLEYNINEKISPKLIQKTALSEMYAPIIDGVKSLFEEQYIPLDVTGSKKLRELKAENAELQKSLKKQLSENLRLAEVAEVNSKKALISEKTEGMTQREKSKVKNFFESKSFSETKTDIDNYIEMLDEQAEEIRAFRSERQHLFEQKSAPVRRSKFIEDKTESTMNDRKKERVLSKNEEFLLGSSRFCD